MSKNSSKSIFGVIGIILLIIGIFAWTQEFSGNPGATNLSNQVPWGLYIVLFLFLEMVGAGALFFGALHKSSKLLIIGITALVGAAVAIISDLGSPLIIWRLLLSPNFSAPIFLDVCFLAFNVICAIILLFALRRNEKLIRIFQTLQYILAIALPLGTAWLFTTMAGKPGWGSSLEAAVFITSTILAGFILANVVLRDDSMLRGILICAGALLILFLMEIGGVIYSTINVETAPLLALISGSYAWLFWGMLVLLFLLPIAWGIITKKGGLPIITLLSIGLLVNKFLFVVKGNIYPYGRLGKTVVIPAMSFDGQPFITYWPGIYEWLVALGIIGFTIVFYYLILSLEKEEETV